MSQKVLITAKVNPWLLETLTAKGFEPVYQPAITTEEVMALLPEITGLIVTTRLKVDKAMLDSGHRLKWIGRLGSGMELIDVAYAESKGITCVSSPDGNCDAVGEQALGMLLCLRNNILKSNLELRKGIWEREGNRGWELNGKTVGIIGFGHTGQAFTKKLQGFDVKILANDKYKSGFDTDVVKQASLEEIYAQADVVSLHLPLTKETHHLANTQFFNAFAKPVYFLNTSRGKVVDTTALVAALDAGKLAGAGLDVFENEKMATFTPAEKTQFDYLLRLPNVVLTPHIAGYSHEASIKMPQYVLEKLGILPNSRI
ncbi:D-3-phosphoglycerate dehydrogenase [Chitinophaga costaii]|uniref:D-3-phosphoglycerate dehydrogenase n=1 Tax=Chitinophaga costaii TaxID=1335309 RepID=A0A1C4F3Q4_9BACT|nr:NAD(P)-dependent oxidoreductase [Chitinophaga costaii]PUZ22085.1 hydroxyacid dehydrogenase [Chitinophaga costaii]SCC50570.1 D-3-phosphoglycerate dehydrogenase [Chitinophaga costaii]